MTPPSFEQKEPEQVTAKGFGRRALTGNDKELQPARTAEASEEAPLPFPAADVFHVAAPSNVNHFVSLTPDKNAKKADAHHTALLDAVFRKVWMGLKSSVDFRTFATMSQQAVHENIFMVVSEVARQESLHLSQKEIQFVTKCVVDEMMGLGPIEPLLANDAITEIMVNGPKTVYLEINGKIEKAAITFRDSHHLMTVCQRIAAQVGRRVDESSPICDARLPDGSRVNIIMPPLAIDGAVLTIRKFQKERLTLDSLLSFGSVNEICAEMLRMIAACRINVLISGGTGSGKTTLLNCLTRYINAGERIVTCEDAAELQLQQPHVVRLETRPPNLEGAGEVVMRDLVRNCLRMRPDRIIVGEVRGPEAFDLLQAMNTGHDGSMGTVHANTPRDALARLENMIAMGRLNIPAETIRQQIASSVNVIVQIQRLRDGSRKIMSITEITGMEGSIISTQDLITYEVLGETAGGKVQGRFKLTGLRPRFSEKLRQFDMEERFFRLLEADRQK